jgi:phosphatidylserine/phosphatidylglycerophosphate/cardiolipin synthase-like enzyme
MRLIVHEGNGASSAFKDAIEEVAEEGSLSIAVPYFNLDILLPLINDKEWRLITDGNECFKNLNNKAKVALIEFWNSNLNFIRHKHFLHAKVIIGKAKALLGSANYTHLGLGKRDEAAVLLEGDIVNELQKWYTRLWSESNKTFLDAKRTLMIKNILNSKPTTSEAIFLKNNYRAQTKLLHRSKKKAQKAPTTEAEYLEKLLKVLRISPSRDWIDGYLDLMRIALLKINLPSRDKHIRTTARDDDKALRLNANNRLALSSRTRKQ